MYFANENTSSATQNRLKFCYFTCLRGYPLLFGNLCYVYTNLVMANKTLPRLCISVVHAQVKILDNHFDIFVYTPSKTGYSGSDHS